MSYTWWAHMSTAIATVIISIMSPVSRIHAAATCSDFSAWPESSSLSLHLKPSTSQPNPDRLEHSLLTVEPPLDTGSKRTPVWSLCTLLRHILVRMLRVLTEAIFGWANGRWALLSLFFLYCLYFLICFVMSMHALHLYQEKNYFWFLETLVVATSRKVSLKASTQFWALLLNLMPPQHLPFPVLCPIYMDLRVLCRYS